MDMVSNSPIEGAFCLSTLNFDDVRYFTDLLLKLHIRKAKKESYYIGNARLDIQRKDDK